VPPALEPLRGVPVLVVDDHPAVRRVLADTLAEFGLTPVGVPDRAAARAELTRAAAAGAPYPLVLIDAGLPDGDGFALAREARGFPAEPAVVMLLCAGDRKGELARGRQSGARAQAAKPVGRRELVRALLQAAGAAEADLPGGEPRAPAADAPRARRLRVLLVEDNPFNQQVGVAKLERKGHAVRVAACGRDALAALAEAPFELVLMDMQMPDMDGAEVTAVIRRQEAGSGGRLPVVAMTAHATKEIRDRCLAAGMDGFVSKPINDADLWRAIAAAVPADAGVLVDEPAEAAPTTTADEGGPAADVLARVGNNLTMLHDLLDVFRDDCAQLLPDLREAVRQQDGPRLAAAAHTIKGLVAFFESAAGTRAAVQLEEMGGQGTFAGAQDAIATLARETERILAVYYGVATGGQA
jgi:CheY-like chemotaxis protein/HPt (histidine-containing phosphotransfer) domain-containing protein